MAADEPVGIGELVRCARMAAGQTQEELAARAGLSVRGLSDLERGLIQAPHPETMRRLAGALQLGPEEQASLHAARRGRSARRPVRPTDSGAAPPADPAAPGALPLPLTSFVGRAKELADLQALLAQPHLRLLTLTGAGGVGKTRLALRVAEEARDGYAEGARLVALGPLGEPALVPQVLARAIGIPERPGRSPEAALVDALGARRLLLVLDNCEHLLAACARLADALLRACPGLRILATSREPLGVPGEVAWRVAPLAVPPPDQEAPAGVGCPSESVLLFTERARAARPDVALDARQAAAVAEICRRLDGLPLAIELAAARVRTLLPTEVAARLDDRFRLLTAGSRTAPARQQTLRATLDWSYDLLAGRERRLFDRLAVFAGGFTLAAAEAVCSDRSPGGIGRAAVLDLLARLVDRSLVLADPGSDRGETRYGLLETMRAYAAERLAARGEAAALRGRHAAWVLELAERAERAFHGPEEGAWLRRVEDERDNARAAQAWLLDHGEADTALRLAGALWWYWFAGPSRSWAEGRAWLERALALPRPPTAARAKALAAAALQATFQGDHDAAQPRLEESAAIARDRGDVAGALTAQGHRVLLHAFAGDYTAADALAEETLAFARRVGDAWFEGRMLSIRARAAMRRGDCDAAAQLLGGGVAVARRAGDEWSLAMALEELGDVERLRGAPARARARYEESLALRRRRPGGWSPSLEHNLGYVALAEGDLAAAAACFARALAEFRRHGEQRGVAECLIGRGAVAAAEGQAAAAAWLLGAGEAALEGQGSRLWPSNRADYDRALARIRAGLDAATFDAAWAAGRRATPQEAVAAAEGSLPPEPPGS